VTQHRYVVPGWGTGEVWVEESVLLLHDLAGTLGGVPCADGALVVSGDAPAGRLPPAVSAQAEPGAAAPHPPSGGLRAPTGTLAGRSSRVGDRFASSLCRRFARHLAGRRTSYDDVEVDESTLAPFQRDLLHALRAVPWGEVVSYGELAALAGRPRAARAAGTFCAGNQLSLVVPCHRVVAGDGIGGYGPSGVELKRRLLRLEGIEL
jgi:methylated-DNA-[protein]-cysteine S-methyltransferase